MAETTIKVQPFYRPKGYYRNRPKLRTADSLSHLAMRKVFRAAYHQEWLIRGINLRYWPEEVWWPLPLSPAVKKAYWDEFKVFWEKQDRLFLAAGDGGMCLCARCFGEEWK